MDKITWENHSIHNSLKELSELISKNNIDDKVFFEEGLVYIKSRINICLYKFLENSNLLTEINSNIRNCKDHIAANQIQNAVMYLQRAIEIINRLPILIKKTGYKYEFTHK